MAKKYHVFSNNMQNNAKGIIRKRSGKLALICKRQYPDWSKGQEMYQWQRRK